MNKAVPFFIIAIVIIIIAAWYLNEIQQNRKINKLFYGFNGLQANEAQNNFTTQVVQQQLDDINNKIEQADVQRSKDYIWASKPEPIAISTAD